MWKNVKGYDKIVEQSVQENFDITFMTICFKKTKKFTTKKKVEIKLMKKDICKKYAKNVMKNLWQKIIWFKMILSWQNKKSDK